jgi:deoxyribodipyrimidine photolyase-related protein
VLLVSNMSTFGLVFPHQLFEDNPILPKSDTIVIIEEWLYFNQFQFHKQKLVLHRASMQNYQAYLQSLGKTVVYINAQNKLSKIENWVASSNATTLHVVDVVDNWLYKHLTNAAKKSNIALKWYATPNFLRTTAEYDAQGLKKYFQTDFYVLNRKHFKILLEPDGKPHGGKWTYDADNRKTYPKDKTPPELPTVATTPFVTEAIAYVEKHYKNNYGNTQNFIYPINFTDTKKWLQNFLQKRFADFGVYEDAMVENQKYLNHSVLTPMLNIGLITPKAIIDEAIKYATKNEVPLNSLEGFIRQIMGWREFIRYVYVKLGSQQRTINYWQFTRKIPKAFWQGTTGIKPIDDAVTKNADNGYNHHIERLMVLGNFMLLCEFDPNEVHKWFMEMYADAYDWVMVPNVYGMITFADGGLITTKPYISGSNYILKMSNYKKEPWCEIWDALFWRFMYQQKTFFSKNPRLGMLVKTFEKMPQQKQHHLLTTANNYLTQLDNAQ